MKKKGRYLLMYWGPVLAVCLAIFIQSSFRSPEIIPDISHLDKIMHMAAYAILAALFFRAYQPLGVFRDRPWGLLCISIVSAALYGLSDEIHQACVAVRHADIYDWLADGAGSIVGALLYMKILTIISHRRLPD